MVFRLRRHVVVLFNPPFSSKSNEEISTSQVTLLSSPSNRKKFISNSNIANLPKPSEDMPTSHTIPALLPRTNTARSI
jgi:hypothetical protein